MRTDKTIDSCFLTPILPHKIGNVKDYYDDISETRRGDAEQLLRSAGVKKSLAFIQETQIGDFIVQYIESMDDIDRTLMKIAKGDTDFSSYVRNSFKDCCGVDRSNPNELPKLERLFSWKDQKAYLEEQTMLKMPWAWATPILPGKSDEVKRFWSERQGKHLKDAEEHFKSLDIIRMEAFLQHTPKGDFLLQYMCASDQLDKVLVKCMSRDTPSSQYVKNEYIKFSGIDYTKQDNWPQLQLVFDWDDVKGFQTVPQEIAYTE